MCCFAVSVLLYLFLYYKDVEDSASHFCTEIQSSFPVWGSSDSEELSFVSTQWPFVVPRRVQSLKVAMSIPLEKNKKQDECF